MAEAGAFHADLILELDRKAAESSQPNTTAGLGTLEPSAALRKVLLTRPEKANWKPAANVAVVVDDLDTSDEVMNLLARHNIPVQSFASADLKSKPSRLRRFGRVRKA